MSKSWKQSQEKIGIVTFLVICLLAVFLVASVVLGEAILIASAYGLMVLFGLIVMVYTRQKKRKFYRQSDNKQAYVQENVLPLIELLKQQKLYGEQGVEWLIHQCQTKRKNTPFVYLMRQVVILVPLTLALLSPFYLVTIQGLISWLMSFFQVPEENLPQVYLFLFFGVIAVALLMIGIIMMLYPFISLVLFSEDETLRQLQNDLQLIQAKNGKLE